MSEVIEWTDEDIERDFPQLRLTYRNERRALLGKFPVRLLDGKVVDQYLIEIHVPANLDVELPTVWENEGRIPRTQDRHCLEGGSLCVLLPETRFKCFPKGSTLHRYLKGPLNSYLFGQSYFEHYKEWPFGQWAHGVHGRRDFYREFFFLAVDSGSMVLRLLETVADGSYRRHKPCPCGSGRRTKCCHWKLQCDLDRLVNRKILKQAEKELQQYFANHPEEQPRPGLKTLLSNASGQSEFPTHEISTPHLVEQ